MGVLPYAARRADSSPGGAAVSGTGPRGLVFHGDAVLIWREADGIHLLPGGRRENGETLEATLRRELLEETGWQVCRASMLGFMHYHHLGPEPAGLSQH